MLPVRVSAFPSGPSLLYTPLMATEYTVWIREQSGLRNKGVYAKLEHAKSQADRLAGAGAVVREGRAPVGALLYASSGAPRSA